MSYGLEKEPVDRTAGNGPSKGCSLAVSVPLLQELGTDMQEGTSIKRRWEKHIFTLKRLTLPVIQNKGCCYRIRFMNNGDKRVRAMTPRA